MAFSKLVTLSQQTPFTPPSLSIYQASYGGLVFGGLTQGATYQFVAIPSGGGVDMPNVQTADSQKALDQGEFGGIDISGGRDLSYQQVVTASTAAAMEAARQALGGVMAVGGTTELPFYLQLNGGQYACMGRPRKHVYKVDINSVLPALAGVAGGDTVLSTLHATDPRWYAMPIRVAGPVGLPAPLGGLHFNVTPNFTFGGGSAGGYLAAYNDGQFEMRPVLIITGPCTNPMVTNQSLANDPSIGFNITLNAGDTLTIYTDTPNALYLPSGGSTPVSVLRDEMTSNAWWNLAPANGPQGIGGPNNLVFTSTDGAQVAGTLTVYSADAYMAL
jgi:hypothetical protein